MHCTLFACGRGSQRQFESSPIPGPRARDPQQDQQCRCEQHVLAENRRLSALPEIAKQFRVLSNAKNGVSVGVVYSAFELDGAALADLSSSLEKRFGKRLTLTQAADESLIGGVRVVVGDEVFDTSIKARLEQMQVALTA